MHTAMSASAIRITQTGIYSCSRSPELVERADIMEFELDGTPVGGDRNPYLERFIHGATYERNPDTRAVVHSHAEEVLFTIFSSRCSRSFIPLTNGTGTAGLGYCRKIWRHHSVGRNMDQGRDLAEVLATRRIVLMRGTVVATGRSLSEVVRLSVMSSQRPHLDDGTAVRRREAAVAREVALHKT